MKNIVDLVRHLLPGAEALAPADAALGSGDPTRAIWSTLISQAFQSIDSPSCRTFM